MQNRSVWIREEIGKIRGLGLKVLGYLMRYRGLLLFDFEVFLLTSVRDDGVSIEWFVF